MYLYMVFTWYVSLFMYIWLLKSVQLVAFPTLHSTHSWTDLAIAHLPDLSLKKESENRISFGQKSSFLSRNFDFGGSGFWFFAPFPGFSSKRFFFKIVAFRIWFQMVRCDSWCVAPATQQHSHWARGYLAQLEFPTENQQNGGKSNTPKSRNQCFQ